jgi:hypothetical protein
MVISEESMNRSSRSVFIAYLLTMSFGCAPTFAESACLQSGTDCPTVDRESVTAMTCRCICATPLDDLLGPIDEDVLVCLPPGLNVRAFDSSSLRNDVSSLTDDEYYARANAWCSEHVAPQVENIADGVARLCGQIACECRLVVPSFVEEEACATPCRRLHCRHGNCPRSIFDLGTGEVDIDGCRCTESSFCGEASTGVVCRPAVP